MCVCAILSLVKCIDVKMMCSKLWTLAHILDFHGSMRHNTNLIEMTNKMQLCRTIYYSIVLRLLNMFRALSSLIIRSLYTVITASGFTHVCHCWPLSAALPLACWDRGFESHRGHGYLSVVSVVCCQVEVSASSWSLVQRSPTNCAASLCVI